MERLTGEYLPLLLRTAGDVSADWALWQSRPYSEVRYDQPEGVVVRAAGVSGGPGAGLTSRTIVRIVVSPVG